MSEGSNIQPFAGRWSCPHSVMNSIIRNLLLFLGINSGWGRRRWGPSAWTAGPQYITMPTCCFLSSRARWDQERDHHTAVPGARWAGEIHQLQHPGAGLHQGGWWRSQWADLHPHQGGWWEAELWGLRASSHHCFYWELTAFFLTISGHGPPNTSGWHPESQCSSDLDFLWHLFWTNPFFYSPPIIFLLYILTFNFFCQVLL